MGCAWGEPQRTQQRAIRYLPGKMVAIVWRIAPGCLASAPEARSADVESISKHCHFNSASAGFLSRADVAEWTGRLRTQGGGARRVVPLKVSGAFHTQAMASVQAEWHAVVADAPLRPANIPVVANATANIVTAADALRQELALQLTSPVRWAATIDILMRRNLDPIFEFGPGAVLTRMIGNVATDTRAVSIDSFAGARREAAAGLAA